MSTTTAPIGSAWDALPQGPEAALAHHLAEWVTGSACHPELAAANVQSIAGPVVLEALAGDRLDAMGGHACQYATASVARLLRPLEPVADAGGWWCSGLDPLADWAPMEWGCFKPDQPRWDQDRNRPRKYEHPIKVAARSFWLRVPAVVALMVAERWGLELPSAVCADSAGEAGTFWRWLATEPRLPLVVTEGAKKAAALLSAGIPAVALPGIWNGTPKNSSTDQPELLADLTAVALEGRPVWVLFDWSDSRDGSRAVRQASNRLGRKLKAVGALVKAGSCPGPAKGADDHLSGGGSWEQLAAALKPLTAPPVLPCLPRYPDVTAPAGQLLEHAAPIPSPEVAPVVAMAAPMGSGKTRSTRLALAPFLEDGSARILNLTHRTSLGRAQSEAWGLAWADEAKPGSVNRLQGMGLCVDSACPSSGLRITPGEWRDSVVVLDEFTQVLKHLLFGTGTAVAGRRVPVLETIACVITEARQVIAADAQLSGPALQLLEDLTGKRTHIIGSDHRPFAGRRFHCPEGLDSRKANEQARALLLRLISGGRRFLFWTTAQQASRKNSAQNLAQFHRKHCPEARVLVVDSQHQENAARLAADPNGVAADYDAIYCSPAISSGLSIEVAGHFDAVVLLSGGTVEPEHVAQAAARVRDSGCPVFCFAPERSPGNHLRIGSGDFEPQKIIQNLRAAEQHLMYDLIRAGQYSPETNDPGPWLRCWAAMAAERNRARIAYSATVRGLCEREGWDVISEELEIADLTCWGPSTTGCLQADAKIVSRDLETIANAAQEAEDQAVIEAALISRSEATDLSKSRTLDPADRSKLQRFRVAAAWGLGEVAPTIELMEAHRDQLHRRLRFRWILQDQDARKLVACHDHNHRQHHLLWSRVWAPDLVSDLLEHKVRMAERLDLPHWIDRQGWFTAEDPRLILLQATASAHRSGLAQVLDLSPGKRATTTLISLLRLVACRLESKRSRGADGNCWRYRVQLEALPDGVTERQLHAAWKAQLGDPPGHVPKTPL